MFGPLERGGKAYAQVVPGVSGKTSARVMGGKVPKGSATHADGLPSCLYSIRTERNSHRKLSTPRTEN